MLVFKIGLNMFGICIDGKLIIHDGRIKVGLVIEYVRGRIVLLGEVYLVGAHGEPEEQTKYDQAFQNLFSIHGFYPFLWR